MLAPLFAVLSAVLAVASAGLALWSLKRTKEFRRKYDALARKDPLQLDLELATSEQLLAELKKRPKVQYMLFLPRFDPTGVALQVEVHNIPPRIVPSLLRLAQSMLVRGEHEEAVDDYFSDPPENV